MKLAKIIILFLLVINLAACNKNDKIRGYMEPASASNHVKAVFFVPETLLSQLKLGRFVFAKCDDCVQKISLRISYVSPQVEQDKVYRIEAIPAPRDAFKLHSGQAVEISW